MADDLIPGWDDDGAEVDPAEVPVPGSRPRVDHKQRDRTATLAKTDWDRSPRSYVVNGNLRTDLFPISALLEATGLKYNTVRKWESDGVMPQPAMRGPVKGHARARGYLGQRLYSRAFIEGLIPIIEEEGLVESRRNVAMTNFAARVARLFKETGG